MRPSTEAPIVEPGSGPSSRSPQLAETRAGRLLRAFGLGGVRTTILALALLATFIPSLATGWISYRQNRRAIEAKLDEQLAGASAQAARETGLWLKERLYDLRVFAASYEVSEGIERAAGGRRLLEYLGAVDQRFHDFDALTVAGPDRRVIARSGTVPQPLAFGGEWVQQARLGDPILGEPAADATGRVTMEVAVPIVSATGRFLGVLAARLDLAGLRAPLEGILPADGGRLRIVRPSGATVLTVGPPAPPLDAEALRALEAADGGRRRIDLADGSAAVATLAPVASSDWQVVAEVAEATAFADVRRVRNASILLAVVLLGVVGSLAYGLGLLIVLPIERLHRAAARVAEGDLDVEVAATGDGEVAQLTRVFNGMVRRVREARLALQELSVTDGLTGLANRRRLAVELAHELQRSERTGRPFAVVMLDVDHFKAFNDTHGHPAGDAVLRAIAQVLRASTRDVDTVVRYGGEEFLVVLPETGLDGARTSAERIRAAVAAAPIALDGGRSASVTVSVGVALHPDHADGADALVAAADRALYRSKQGGRDRVTVADGD